MKHFSFLIDFLLELATEYNKCSTGDIWIIFGGADIHPCHKIKILKIPMKIILFDQQTFYKMLLSLPLDLQIFIYLLVQFAKLTQFFRLRLHYSFISQNISTLCQNAITTLIFTDNNLVRTMLKIILQLLPYPIIALVVALLSFAIGGESKVVLEVPLIWLLNTYCFLVQIVAFIPAAIFRTEMFYDLTGSITYLSTLGLVLYFNNLNNKQIIAASLIAIWAFRLGAFLFGRILKRGFDSRFDMMKKKLLRFFFAWFCQGLWTVITPCQLLVMLTKNQTSINSNFNTLEIVGLLIWSFGFIFECVADYQKSAFNSIPQNKGKFIRSGVWSLSRHPNYVGQIIIWIGASVFAVSSLRGWQYVSLVSPIFVYLLLTKLSGVPLLQKQADERWGKDASYVAYKQSTPVLFPFVSSGEKVEKTN